MRTLLFMTLLSALGNVFAMSVPGLDDALLLFSGVIAAQNGNFVIQDSVPLERAVRRAVLAKGGLINWPDGVDPTARREALSYYKWASSALAPPNTCALVQRYARGWREKLERQNRCRRTVRARARRVADTARTIKKG